MHKELFGYVGKDGHYRNGLVDGGMQLVPIRSQKRKLKLQKAVHQRYVSRHFKGAFIPAGEQAVSIRWKGNEPIIDYQNISARYIDFNLRALMRNPEREIARATAKAPKAKSFKYQCGEHQSNEAWPRNLIAERVIKLMNAYAPGGTKYKEYANSSNHFKEWLGGLVAYEFRNQRSFKAYLRSKSEAQQRQFKANRAARRSRHAK